MWRKTQHKKRQRQRQRGGLFTRKANTKAKSLHHNLDKATCPDKDVPCEIFDTKLDGTINPMWMTCINKRGIKYHIKYITPANMLIKSVESFQIPHFNVETPEGVIECKLKIEDKFVSCFLKICGEWYAIMRLFGKTLNDGVLALTVRNRAYYRLNMSHIDLDEKTGVVRFKTPDVINKTNEWYLLATKRTPILNIAEKVWQNVDRNHNVEVFRVLNTFRIQKVIGNVAKYQALGELGSIAT